MCKELSVSQYVLQLLQCSFVTAMDTVFCGELVDVRNLVIGFRLHRAKTVVTESQGQSNDTLFLLVQFLECSCE